MNWFSRWLGRRETRAAPAAGDLYFRDFMAARGVGNASSSNVLANLAVAARCVALRSELLASVPLFLFRRTADGGRERADDNALYDVLHDTSNDYMSAFEFRELMVRSLDLTGNFFARIERNARGQVTALHPFMTGDIQVDRLPNGKLRYRVYNGTRVEILLQEEVLHVRGASRDGVMGLSPIAIAGGPLTLAIAQSLTASAMAENALRPSGLLSFPQDLNNEQIEHVRQSANQAAGGNKAGGTLVVAGGAKYEPISFSPEHAQWIEQRKLSNEDIARIFGLPPTTVGIVDKSTYSNVEQEGRALVQNAIGPLAARIEAAISRCLLTDQGRRIYYAEHDLSGLLRGDVAARFSAYRVGREAGIFSANDIRRLENLPPIEDGDDYHMPSNWVELGAEPVAPTTTAEPVADSSEPH
jgi:HK97 family phage portal protein